jgi:hypothetical protein
MTRVLGATGTCDYISVHDAHPWRDDQLARQSRDELRAFLRNGRIELTREGKDRYGRTLATIRVGGQVPEIT